MESDNEIGNALYFLRHVIRHAFFKAVAPHRKHDPARSLRQMNYSLTGRVARADDANILVLERPDIGRRVVEHTGFDEEFQSWNHETLIPCSCCNHDNLRRN